MSEKPTLNPIIETNLVTDEEKTKLMNEIEIKTENKMKELCKIIDRLEPNQQINLLNQTMQSGVDEFRQKMGRNMTYSEMRMMFG